MKGFTERESEKYCLASGVVQVLPVDFDRVELLNISAASLTGQYLDNKN